jgi:hypothetical protein
MFNRFWLNFTILDKELSRIRMRYLFFITSLIVLVSCQRNKLSKFMPLYENQSFDSIPHYDRIDYWAAHPDKKTNADSVPRAISKTYHPNKIVDVFYVHPTTYLDTNKPDGWNGSLKNMLLNINTDYTAILYQSSVFNEIGKIYAPRYRQANIESYTPKNAADTLKALAAFELAYQDVKKAFEYYLEHNNHGRPIIIASHSQGSTHTKRLLKEFFDGKPLQKQLVVAYIVGMAINPADYSNIKACSSPDETGCICAWRTFEENYLPPFVLNETYTSIVTNPLSWNNIYTDIHRISNTGSILYNFNKIVPEVVGAKNYQGILWTEKPNFLGSFMLNTSNYHIADFNFYYMSIRKNAADRVKRFMNPTAPRYN